jgi:hypothetical protein
LCHPTVLVFEIPQFHPPDAEHVLAGRGMLLIWTRHMEQVA